MIVFLSAYCLGVICTIVWMIFVDEGKPKGLADSPTAFDTFDYLTLPWAWPVLLTRYLKGEKILY